MIDFSRSSDWLQFDIQVVFPSSSLHWIKQLELATFDWIKGRYLSSYLENIHLRVGYLNKNVK